MLEESKFRIFFLNSFTKELIINGQINDELAFKKWNDILDKIILGFESQEKLLDDWGLEKKERNKLEKQWKEGMELYTKWYANLWD